MELFQVRLAESGPDSRLVATSNYNYALTSPKLAARNWRAVSVNGDKVTISTLGGEQQETSRASQGEPTMTFIESLRDELANSSGGGGGQSQVSTASSGGSASGGSFMMSSSSGGPSSSSSSAYSAGGQQTSGSLGAGQMSYNVKDADNFSVARSDFPFNWSRVFLNGELVTLVHRNGDVLMAPLASLAPDQREAVGRIKGELAAMQRSQRQQISNTMQQSVDMVSSVFNSIMGRFPKPPDYQSSVGGIFGNGFPFGPNNSPFSSSSGWPFAAAGGGGASAVAFAGRR